MPFNTVRLDNTLRALQVDPGLFLDRPPGPDPPELPEPSEESGPQTLQVPQTLQALDGGHSHETGLTAAGALLLQRQTNNASRHLRAPHGPCLAQEAHLRVCIAAARAQKLQAATTQLQELAEETAASCADKADALLQSNPPIFADVQARHPEAPAPPLCHSSSAAGHAARWDAPAVTRACQP